jgi:hypothetical protein
LCRIDGISCNTVSPGFDGERGTGSYFVSPPPPPARPGQRLRG